MYLTLLDISNNQIKRKILLFIITSSNYKKVFFYRTFQCMKLSFIVCKNVDVHFFQNVLQCLIKSLTG